jgi:sugar/nucleoside kinase (ribokinase family)
MTTTAENTNLEIICAGIIVADVFLPPIDRLPNEGELIGVDEPAHQVGGCASNTAIALSKLGKKTGIIGMVGSDSIGEQLVRLLINEKINTNAIFKSKEASTSQTIIVPVKNQDRRYIHYFGANSKISVSDLDNGLNTYLYPNQMKIFIFGGYLLMPNIDSKELAALFKKLKDKNYIIILDIAISNNQTGVSEKIKDVLPFVDYFFPNDDESFLITNLEKPQDQAKCFLDWGVKATAITCGTKGVYYKDLECVYQLEPYKINFVDGSGSGDAFTAGMAIGISESWPTLDSLKFGAVLGASVCQGLGCNTTLFSRDEALNEMSKIKVKSLV